MMAQRTLTIAQLITLVDAAYRNRIAHLDQVCAAERKAKDSAERQHIERTDRALCHLYNDGLRVVLRAPVATIEDAQAKAAFLLRPEFEIADLILGDDEATVAGFLRSFAMEKPAAVPNLTPFAEAYAAYRGEIDDYNAREPDEDVSPIEQRFLARVSTNASIKTERDAATALRHVLESDSIGDTFDAKLVQAVCAFLETKTENEVLAG